MKRVLTVIFIAAVVTLAATAIAGYPFVSDIPSQKISMNTATPTIRFQVSDDRTQSKDIAISYKSDNPTLVPEDDNHIILGGTGKDRTVRVIPAGGKWGVATIFIIATDSDGDSNQDSFTVEVERIRH